MAEGSQGFNIGGIFLNVVANLKPLKQQAQGELKKAAEDIGRQMIADIDKAFKAKESKAQRDYAKRILNKAEFKQAGKEAAEEFNKALDARMKDLASRGKLSPAEMIKLEGFKKAGAQAGFDFGEAVRQRAAETGDAAGRRLSGGIMRHMNRLPSLIRAVLGVALFTWIERGLRNIARQVANIATLAGTAQQVRGAFTARAQGAGMEPGELMRELRQATLGTVDSVELMRRANLLLNSELSLSAQNVGELAYLFRRLAEEQGRTAMDGFGAVSESIARLSPRQLAAYGITVRLEDATKKWAEANGRTVSSLTTAERQTALYAAILEQAREKVAALNTEHVSTAQRVQQVTTWWGELKAAIAEGIMQAPRIAAFFDAMGIGASNAADRMGELSDRISAIIEKYGASLTGAGIGALGLGIAGTVVGTPLLGLAGAAVGAFGGSAIGQFWDPKDPLDVIEARIREERLAREAAGKGRPGTGPGGIPNADQLQAADAALRQLTASMREFQAAAEMGVQPLRDAPDEVQAAIRAMVKVQEQVRQAEEQIAAIRAGGKQVPEGAEAYLAGLRAELAELREIAQEEIARWQRDLPLIIRGVEQSVSRLPGYMVQVEGAVRSLDSAVGDLRTQADAVTEAERQLLHARLAQDPDQIARAEKRVANERKRLRDMTAALARALTTAGVPAEKLNELLAEMNALLEDVGVKVDEVAGEEGQRDWESLARSLASAARGVLSIADAMGVLDSRTRKALEAAVDLADGLAKVAASDGIDIGGIVQSAGALIKLGSALFGGDPEAKKRTEDSHRAMRSLIDALYALQKTIVAISTRQMEQDQRQAERGAKALERAPGIHRSGMDRRNALRDAAVELGLISSQERHADPGAATEAIRRWAQDIDSRYGTNLAAFVEAGDPAGLRDALRRLAPEIAAQLGKAGSFGDDAEGTMARINYELDVLGNTDAAERLRAVVAALKAAGHEAGEFQAALDELSTLDLTTEAGRARRDEIVREMMEAATREGAIDFGHLTAQQVRDLILEWSRATSDGSGLIGSGAETRMAVNITQAQGSELLRLQSTSVYHLAGIHSLIARMVSAPPPVYGAIPDMTPPSPASLGLGSQTINLGGITVELALNTTGVTPGNARETGEAIGAGIGGAIDSRLRSAYRGSGASGPARYKVEVQ